MRWPPGIQQKDEPDFSFDLGESDRFSESLQKKTGIQIKIATENVCPGHDAPWEMFQSIRHTRKPLVLVLGARGTGKSYLSALDTHLTSLQKPHFETKILGGSRSQAEQIYRAIREFAGKWPSDRACDPVDSLLKTEARYRNGSMVSILAASPTSVRGPHVPSLKIDEVDEIDDECFEAAMGMCMQIRGASASVMMTSTWHRMDGRMSSLVERSQAGEFPMYSFCAFEVLERCPIERSGQFLENCLRCPLQAYCHDVPEGFLPKAKRSNGHYSIDALIQKITTTSKRTFESDYLCKGPKADGLWFPTFSTDRHVSQTAEYDPSLPTHVSIDSGVFTGAVFFQITRNPSGSQAEDEIHVFADYLSEGLSAESNARSIIEIARTRCNGRLDRISTDPAGGSRNPMGVTVIAEFERAGLRPLERWPIGSISDSLSLVESFTNPAQGPPKLRIHPRCKYTINSFQGYRRAKRGGQWQDYPEDPQHPHEELMDSLRGGLKVCFPEGRNSQRNHQRIQARKVL